MKKLIWGIITLIIIIIGYFSLIGVNQEIMQEYPAIQYNANNDSVVIETNITIKGTLTKKLFRRDTFNGKIKVKNYDWNYSSAILSTINEFEGYYGVINADVSLPNYPTKVEPIASFQTSKNFDKIQIYLSEEDVLIIGPAKSLNEAKLILETLKNMYY